MLKSIAPKTFRLQSPVLDFFLWHWIEIKVGYKFSNLQKRWLSTLLAFPERQHKGRLGQVVDGEPKYCCLGQAAVLLPNSKHEWTHDGCLSIPDSKGRALFLLPMEVTEAYNLRDDDGVFDKDYPNLPETSLAALNDLRGQTWTQIAWFVIENPKAVFNNV